eukprot:1830236-Prymnesium_polylepis.2
MQEDTQTARRAAAHGKGTSSRAPVAPSSRAHISGACSVPRCPSAVSQRAHRADFTLVVRLRRAPLQGLLDPREGAVDIGVRDVGVALLADPPLR